MIFESQADINRVLKEVGIKQPKRRARHVSQDLERSSIRRGFDGGSEQEVAQNFLRAQGVSLS